MSFLQDVLSSLLEQTYVFPLGRDKRSIIDLSNTLMFERCEVSVTQIASAILSKYEMLDQEGRIAFFDALVADFDLDANAVSEAAQTYAKERSPEALHQLTVLSEPRRRELFRMVNQVPGATEKLVRMREDLMALVKEHPDFALIDADFERVFASWFNRGFLLLKPIDWRTPANILEKIIEYEAVHEINDWDDLRRRLQPEDRRCFAFFHPVMPEDPLIFVEVALTKGIPDSIETVLAEDREPLSVDKADTAVFYSISNCQKGLKGVSFGDFLIKQVVHDLAMDAPNLKTFVTLSPVPGFAKWLSQSHATASEGALEKKISDLLEQSDTKPLRDMIAGEEADFKKLMADYMLNAKRDDGFPVDPVARFHLGNGASLARINWMGDPSAKGLAQSFGMMVNYKYDLASVEPNHMAFVNDKKIQTTSEIRTLARK